jgi:hypothetical protein
MTRIGLMLTPPPSSKEPDKKLSLQAQKWFAKMKEIDPNFALIPWKAEDKDKPTIKSVDNIPSTMSKIRTFFSRAQAKTEGGRAFMDTFVQHSVPIDDIRGDSEWFLKENNMGIYNKT